MPHSDAISHLFEKRELTIEEWISAIEGRKAELMPHMKELGQTKLAEVDHPLNRNPVFDGRVGYAQTRIEHLGNSYHGVALEETDTQLREQLSVRGVWIFSGASYSDEVPEHSKIREVGFAQNVRLKKMLVYGFTREEDWVVAEIKFLLINGNVEKEKKVTVRHIKLNTLFDAKASGGYGLQPKDVWMGLGRVVKNHFQRRQKLLEKAQELWRQIEFENSVMFKLTTDF